MSTCAHCEQPYTVSTERRGDSITHTVVSADYHRNGVGGAGFVVALIDSVLEDQGPDPIRFLLTWFKTYSDPDLEVLEKFQDQVAVVRLDMAAAGNIGMFPMVDPETGERIEGTGGNAWRGADIWQAVLPLIERFREDQSAALTASLAAEE